MLGIAFVALLIFGNRLPSVMRSLGKSVTEFKKGVAGIEEDLDTAVTADKKPTATTTTSTATVTPHPRFRPPGPGLSGPSIRTPRLKGGIRSMFGNLNPMELMIVVGLAVLLFGKRLPEVGRTLGKGIVEFKKGIKGLEDEFRYDEHTHHVAKSEPVTVPSDLVESSVPKFEPPTAAPVRQGDPAPPPRPSGLIRSRGLPR